MSDLGPWGRSLLLKISLLSCSWQIPPSRPEWVWWGLGAEQPPEGSQPGLGVPLCKLGRTLSLSEALPVGWEWAVKEAGADPKPPRSQAWWGVVTQNLSPGEPGRTSPHPGVPRFCLGAAWTEWGPCLHARVMALRRGAPGAGETEPSLWSPQAAATDSRVGFSQMSQLLHPPLALSEGLGRPGHLCEEPSSPPASGISGGAFSGAQLGLWPPPPCSSMVQKGQLGSAARTPGPPEILLARDRTAAQGGGAGQELSTFRSGAGDAFFKIISVVAQMRVVASVTSLDLDRTYQGVNCRGRTKMAGCSLATYCCYYY